VDADQERDAVARATAGDGNAFRALVEAHEGRVQACARYLLGDPREAEDIAQEVFLRAHRALGRFDGRSRFGTWIHRIAVNACLQQLRGRKARRPLPAVAGVDPGRADGVELRRRLLAALESLTPSLRVAVVLVLVEGFTHAEAAEVLGCAEGTVSWRVHEARRRLQTLLGGEPRPGAARAATDGGLR